MMRMATSCTPWRPVRTCKSRSRGCSRRSRGSSRSGTTKRHRLEENNVAADIDLTADDLREIEHAQIDAHGARYSDLNEQLIDR